MYKSSPSLRLLCLWSSRQTRNRKQTAASRVLMHRLAAFLVPDLTHHSFQKAVDGCVVEEQNEHDQVKKKIEYESNKLIFSVNMLMQISFPKFFKKLSQVYRLAFSTNIIYAVVFILRSRNQIRKQIICHRDVKTATEESWSTRLLIFI